MSTIYDDLVLYLKLDDIDLQTQKVADSSKSKKDGAANGEVSLVADDTFGACLQFDGTNDQVSVDRDTLKAVTNTFTMAAWVIPTTTHRIDNALRSGTAGTAQQKYMFFPISGGSYGSSNDASAGISVGTNGISIYEHTASYMPAILVWSKPVDNSALSTNGWTHIAVVYRDKTPSLYVNGQQVATGSSPSPKSSIHPVGEIGGGAYGYFPGKITNFRVYKRALSEFEILQVMDEDELASSTYRAGHPITFKLFDENQDYVLYISNDPKLEHTLQLELTNTSSQAIQFKDLSEQPASATNHHFELIFRPNTLSRETIAALKEPDQAKRLAKILSETDGKDWDIALSNVTGDGLNQFVSLYVLYKKGGEFKSSEKRIVTLQNMTAEASTGSRGTQVELKLNNLTYVGGPSSTTGAPVQITGSRVQNLHITNHAGRKHIPLHVGFVGSNRILNDGVSSNELKLRITNTSKIKDPISLKGATFTLSFDRGEGDLTQEWAIATASDTAANAPNSTRFNPSITFTYPKSSSVDLRDPTRGQGTFPEWEFTLPMQLEPLKFNEYIDIKISGIKTNYPTGHTNLYVDYKNVPGYWEGQFVCVIEKAPLLFAQGKVGIGIALGTIRNTLDESGYIKNILDVMGGASIRGGFLVGGKVGIGASSLSISSSYNLLEVHGGVSIGKNYSERGGASEPNSLIVEGKVGIGTNVPNCDLHVTGKAVIGEPHGTLKSSAPTDGLYVKGGVVTEESITATQIKLPSRPNFGIDASIENQGYGHVLIRASSIGIMQVESPEIEGGSRIGLRISQRFPFGGDIYLGADEGVSYLETISNSIKLRIRDTDRLTIDKDGNVYITGKLYVNNKLIAQ